MTSDLPWPFGDRRKDEEMEAGRARSCSFLSRRAKESSAKETAQGAGSKFRHDFMLGI